ncbi:MAG TPA: DUF2125 domain-containing protein [Terricaulis sp.]|nr:DUF2125 domain-containing protein [Terricaulis sp.]
MKARWLWLIIPWVIFIALAVGWVAYWNMLASGARERVQAWVASEQARGADMSIGAVTPKGFPMLLRLELADIAYAPAEGGWRLSTSAGALHVQMFNPEHVIFQAQAPIAFARDNGDVTNISADALIVSVRGAGGALAQAGVEADNLTLDDPAEPGVLSARKLVFNLRPDPRAANDMQVSLEAQGLMLAQPVRSFEGLGQDVESMMLALVIEQSAALTESAPNDPLAPWRAAGGRVRVEGLVMKWGALDAAGVGRIALDDQRRLTGELNLPIKEPAAFFAALNASPEVDENARLALELLSRSFARSGEGLTLDLEGRDGVLRIEGLAARTLPPVY